MQFNPHDYQKYTIEYIMSHPVAAVILGLGMGKTVCSLTAIEELMYDRFEISKVLIVAPLRVAKITWSDEIEKWDHLKHLSYAIAVGTEKERLAALQSEADIYIINRENLQWLIEKSGTPFDYDMVVLDELSSFKNWQSKRFKAFMKVRPKVSRVIGLTGSPSSNGMMDLFAEYRCLDMGERLGRFITQYRGSYFTPDRMNGQVVYSYKLLPGSEQQIYDKISDITVSLKAMDHLKMPELISVSYPVYMDEEEQKKYDQLKADLILPFKDQDNITAANAAALSGKLCQMANGAVYSDEREVAHIHDRKIEVLEDIIEAADGPILLCYWYKHDLERICKKLDELKVEYARISSDGSIRMWNEGKFKVGLIHPASAGHGLNLQAGGHVMVFFSMPWSLELYDQVRGRIFRQGQKSDTVVIQHIVTAGTIDERILKVLSAKERDQEALIDAVKAEL